eukprot:TRINITY_DN39283_c0_g1_i1.p1 TRINITY_DN39283_c0_g1~~TRINITY_DN39283_c0_g1_i1.p1  ORF type:complete len:495 (-),score=87.95 TRINITY_DN39283_c0_g1_i1:93-1577(-)
MASPAGSSAMSRRRKCSSIWALATAGASAIAVFLQASPAALQPAPLSRGIARAPSMAPDRWPNLAPKVAILPQPVERPLERYLYKRDPHFGLIVPDWRLQYRTIEQQFLYKGDFSVFVKEITDDGAVVQDIVTGTFGFVPKEMYGSKADQLMLGATVHGARAKHLDNSIIESEHVELLRMQTGVVHEWDEALGEGYILPTEGQNTFDMLRVFRRDIDWHDSRILFPGQFVQFETVLPEEVPIEANDDPNSRFALRVRPPEVIFSFDEAYDVIRPGAPRQFGFQEEKLAYLKQAVAKEPRIGDGDEHEVDDDSASENIHGSQDSEAITKSVSFPVQSGRPEHLEMRLPGYQQESSWEHRKKSHPVLQRFAEQQPAVAEAESPSWMWQPHLEYLKSEHYNPIVPLQREALPELRPKFNRVLVSEVAYEKGDTWQEPAWILAKRQRRDFNPARRTAAESAEYSLKLKLAKERRAKELLRARKRRIAELYKAEHPDLY